MAAGERLPLAWFQRPTPVVARALIGCVLVHGDRAGRIVETEAYLGPEDRASHARFGPTARNRVMFGPGGVTYVYLCYGIHQMFNIVSDRDGQAGSVLVREWRGVVHRVLVVDNGFEHRDKRYRSLTKVARAITGTRWSGPRFFGLDAANEKAPSAGDRGKS